MYLVDFIKNQPTYRLSNGTRKSLHYEFNVIKKKQ